MKDAYSFDLDDKDAQISYNKMFFSYLKTFKRLGLKAIPMAADTGPIGGDLSHEFVILADTGESKIYSDKRIFDVDVESYDASEKSIEKMRSEFGKYYAVTDDKFNKKEFDQKVNKKDQLETRGIEVGHIFYFGDKYSKPLNGIVSTKEGPSVAVKMGSYGVGVSRLVGAIIEAKYNNEIMVWPNSIAPFQVAIIPNVKKNDKSNLEKAEKLYKFLKKQSIDVLLDDTDESLSYKFKKFDLLGIPNQIIVGSKSTDDKFEFKKPGMQSENLKIQEIIKKL